MSPSDRCRQRAQNRGHHPTSKVRFVGRARCPCTAAPPMKGCQRGRKDGGHGTKHVARCVVSILVIPCLWSGTIRRLIRIQQGASDTVGCGAPLADQNTALIPPPPFALTEEELGCLAVSAPCAIAPAGGDRRISTPSRECILAPSRSQSVSRSRLPTSGATSQSSAWVA